VTKNAVRIFSSLPTFRNKTQNCLEIVPANPLESALPEIALSKTSMTSLWHLGGANRGKFAI
jgi:hypothetical protein